MRPLCCREHSALALGKLLKQCKNVRPGEIRYSALSVVPYTFLLLLLFRRAAAVTNCQASSRQAGRGKGSGSSQPGNRGDQLT